MPVRCAGAGTGTHPAEDITPAIDAAKASGAAALNVLSSPFLYGNRRTIMQRVAALGLPAIYQFPEEAEEGGFVASARVSSKSFES
jgi:hypothetical protein